MGSARSTTGKNSNPHRLPKSAVPLNVQSEQVSVATPGSSKIFEEVGKAVALLRESLGQALWAVWSDFGNKAVLGFLNFFVGDIGRNCPYHTVQHTRCRLAHAINLEIFQNEITILYFFQYCWFYTSHL